MNANDRFQPTRREFIHRASLTMAGGAAALLGAETRRAEAAPPKTDSAPQRPRPLKFSSDMRDGLKPRRVAGAELAGPRVDPLADGREGLEVRGPLEQPAATTTAISQYLRIVSFSLSPMPHGVFGIARTAAHAGRHDAASYSQ